MARGAAPSPGAQPLTPCTSRMVFWMGDLNYRLAGLPTEAVKGLVECGALAKLMQYDQVGLGARPGPSRALRLLRGGGS